MENLSSEERALVEVVENFVNKQVRPGTRTEEDPCCHSRE